MLVRSGLSEDVEEEVGTQNQAKPHREARERRDGLVEGRMGLDWGKLCGWGES